LGDCDASEESFKQKDWTKLSIASADCVQVKENIYLASDDDEVLECISDEYGLNFNRKMVTLDEIKKLWRTQKNNWLTYNAMTF